ncbi:hypothetical protein GNZ24_04270 [Burkholderia thailandensis]|nr:hypothetical protein [Burkholderia thailandensis]
MTTPAQFARATCPHDCPDTCAIRVTGANVGSGVRESGAETEGGGGDCRRMLLSKVTNPATNPPPWRNVIGKRTAVKQRKRKSRGLSGWTI